MLYLVDSGQVASRLSGPVAPSFLQRLGTAVGAEKFQQFVVWHSPVLRTQKRALCAVYLPADLVVGTTLNGVHI